MRFKRNVPGWERLVRIAAGLGLIVAVAVVPLAGAAGWAVGLGGGSLVLSSLLGFCPACALMGRRPS